MNILLNDTISYFSGILWFGTFNTKLFILVVLLIVLVVVFILVELFKNKKLKDEKKLVHKYDDIVYLVSWYNYQTWTNDALVMFEKIFSSKKPAYIAKRKVIFDSVEKLEEDFWKKIVPKEHWQTINKLVKKVGFSLFLFRLLKIIAILVLLLLVLWVLLFLVLK